MFKKSLQKSILSAHPNWYVSISVEHYVLEPVMFFYLFKSIKNTYEYLPI